MYGRRVTWSTAVFRKFVHLRVNAGTEVPSRRTLPAAAAAAALLLALLCVAERVAEDRAAVAAAAEAPREAPRLAAGAREVHREGAAAVAGLRREGPPLAAKALPEHRLEHLKRVPALHATRGVSCQAYGLLRRCRPRDVSTENHSSVATDFRDTLLQAGRGRCCVVRALCP